MLAVGALLLIPVLYLSLLSLSDFGTEGMDTASKDVLNDNSKIMQNIESIESRVEAALREKHDETIHAIEVWRKRFRSPS